MEVIGSFFKAWDRQVYYCESKDDEGYWMVNVRIPHERTNVSGAAIGRTFHVVWNLDVDVQMHGHPFTTFGRLSQEDVDSIYSYRNKLPKKS
jgi:hypothetical protein